MTDYADLVRRLREAGRTAVIHEAADAIEQLQAERDAQHDGLVEALGHWADLT